MPNQSYQTLSLKHSTKYQEVTGFHDIEKEGQHNKIYNHQIFASEVKQCCYRYTIHLINIMIFNDMTSMCMLLLIRETMADQ